MIESKKKPKKISPKKQTEIKKLRKALKSFDPQSKVGETLLKLSEKGLENGVEVLDADEIMAELGRI